MTTKKELRIKIVCAKCGSENVTRDTLARWSVADQKWEVSSELDNFDCDDCCNEVSVNEIKIK